MNPYDEEDPRYDEWESAHGYSVPLAKLMQREVAVYDDDAEREYQRMYGGSPRTIGAQDVRITGAVPHRRHYGESYIDWLI